MNSYVEEIEKRIKKVLEKIRPYLMSEGGDCEYLRFENGIVYIKMLGACEGCSLMDSTIKDGIEALLMDSIPEVIGVINEADLSNVSEE